MQEPSSRRDIMEPTSRELDSLSAWRGKRQDDKLNRLGPFAPFVRRGLTEDQQRDFLDVLEVYASYALEMVLQNFNTQGIVEGFILSAPDPQDQDKAPSTSGILDRDKDED